MALKAMSAAVCLAAALLGCEAVHGIAVLDGVVYLGMGSKTQPSKSPHRVNILGRFDAETLEELEWK